MHWLYLFRHGETDFNREQRFQGHLDIPLNQEGRRQAGALIRPLQRIGVECILSSDLSRARETADIVAHGLSIPVFQTSGLREAHLGNAEGLTASEIEARFGSEIVERWKSPYMSDADVSYPGGETGRAVLNRVLHSLETFILESNYCHIGIATHGGVIRRLVRHLMQDHSTSIPIPNGIVYPLHYDSYAGKWSLLSSTPIQMKYLER